MSAAGLEAENSLNSVTWSTERRDAPGIVRLLGHLGLIAFATVVTSQAQGLLYWPAAFVQGVLMVFLFCALHESVHRTAFKSRWINAVVCDAVGFMLCLPPRWFAAFHMAHHRHTQDPDRDPEMAMPKPDRLSRYSLVVSGAVYWWFALSGLVRRALGQTGAAYYDERSRRRSVTEARVYLVLYAFIAAVSLATGSAFALIYWIIPLLLAQPVMRLYLLAEHWGCPSVRNMWENTRTTLTWAPLRYIAWNMPFHAEHHANPGVPFHQLPAFAASPDAKPEVVQQGYTAFHAGRIRDVAAGRAGLI